MIPKWLKISAGFLGVLFGIPVLVYVGLIIFMTANYSPSDIENFSPVEFQEKASSAFFYSIGRDLKYSESINPEADTLVNGNLGSVVPSPNNQFAAVIVDSKLVVISRDGDDRHEVAAVDSIWPKPGPIGKVFYRDDGFQWSRDSKTLYFIRDEFYKSQGSQLFSDKGELWAFDVHSKQLRQILTPFPAHDFFLGKNGNIYFSVPNEDGDLVLHAYNGSSVVDLEVVNNEVVEPDALWPGTKEELFYTFSMARYEQLFLESKGVFLVKSNDIQSLIINDIPVLRMTLGKGPKGSFYALSMLGGAFLPGDRYLLIKVHAGNYDGKLLIDSYSGNYKTLAKDTHVYPITNIVTYKNYIIKGDGIQIVF